MSNAIPPIMVQIAADVSQLKAGLAQAEASIKGMNGTVATANTGMQNMIGTAKRMAGTLGVAFAATQVVQFGKDVVMAASSMNESISKVNVVFGESADAVFKFGDSAAKNMGMSNQAAIEAAGTYGNLFQAFGIGQGKANEMSTTLVQLAADLGSFNNTSTEEAINALRSGLAGEAEPLKRFGVALNEVTLKNKAMAMGFGEIKGAMDPAIKAQVTYALVMEQTKLAQGDYARTADGTANTMKTLSAQFADAKVAIGDVLLPAFNALLGVFKVAIPILKGLADFIKKNKDLFDSLAIGVGVVTVAFLVYKGVMIASTTATKLFAVAQVLMKGGQLASIASTNTLAASILRLNFVMKANPIGLIVTALGLLAAGFVYAWKNSETFKGVVIKVVQAIANAFAKLVEITGKFFSALGKVPGMGWAKTVGKSLDDISTKIQKTSDGLSKLKSGFATTGAPGIKGSKGNATGGTTDDTTGGTTINAADAKKRADEIKKTLKDVAEAYKDMNKVIKDSQDKVAEATKRRDEAMADANKRYLKEVAQANKRYAETIASEDKKLMEATAAAYKRNKEQTDSINKEYAKRTADIEQKLQETITDLRQKAAEKSADVTKKAAERQKEIIEQSVNRLRSAFASKTGFNIAEAFGGGKSTEGLLSDLKTKLSAAKDLAKNAASLQAKGFSQTFIEQVVSAGPEVGNSLAQSILNSSPESIRELQTTFKDMENTSNYGLDALAKSMNTGANLATQELRDAYNQVALDLQESIAEINKDLTEALAEANKNYSEAMVEAKTSRDEKLAEAAKDLMEALAEADKNYKEVVAEAQKTLDEALAEAAQVLADTLADVMKTYNEALDQIAKDTQARIDDLRAKLIELAALLASLKASQAALTTLTNAPIYNPVLPVVLGKNGEEENSGGGGGGGGGSNYNMAAAMTKTGAISEAEYMRESGGKNINITQNIQYPTADANQISAMTLGAIKFGTVMSAGIYSGTMVGR